MKRLIPLFVFTLLSLVAGAQRFRAGIFAGPTITDVDGTDLIDKDNDFYKFGFTAGGLVNTKISPKSIVQMEIAFTEKGSQQLPDSTHNNNYYHLALNYVDVTLLWKHQLRLSINKNPTDKFGFEGGITFGTLVYSLYTVKSQPQPITLTTTDASLLVGLYYNFTPNFYFSGSYSNSIIPVIKHNAFPSGAYGLYYSTWNKGNNLMFQLTLGIIFGKAPEATGTTPPPSPDNN